MENGKMNLLSWSWITRDHSSQTTSRFSHLLAKKVKNQLVAYSSGVTPAFERT